VTCTLQAVEKHFEKLQSLVEAHKQHIDSKGGDSLFVSRAWDWIVRSLCSGNWSRGSEISEAEVARKLGMSRIPIRAATDTLTQEGWTRRIPRQS
jgi:DNA-binding GntR family transcriptional regulator